VLTIVSNNELLLTINSICIYISSRGALITGYLPHEITSQSIFNFVYHEDRLVKLHALWKCKLNILVIKFVFFFNQNSLGVTTGASKLQWRLNARDGSLVFLQTEYKLIANHHQNQDTIVARNEVLRFVVFFQIFFQNIIFLLKKFN